MSFVLVSPSQLMAAAADVAGIGSAISAANAAALAPTSVLAAAGADEVSAAVAALFSAHAGQYQQLGARAALFHEQFVQALTGAASAYASAEATNVEQQVLGLINAPTQALLGRPLIGNGADGTAANPNGLGRVSQFRSSHSGVDDGAGQQDAAEVGQGVFVVAGCDAAPLLESMEAAFDGVA